VIKIGATDDVNSFSLLTIGKSLFVDDEDVDDDKLNGFTRHKIQKVPLFSAYLS
jgi:hypothetical protein